LLAGFRVVADKKASIEQRVEVIAVDQCGRVVGAEQRLIPGDKLIARLARLERDVTRRSRTYGINRSWIGAGISGADIQEPVPGKRTRHDVDRHATELPKRGSIEAVRTNLVAARSDDLSAELVLPDERCGPALHLLAFRSPNLCSCSFIVCRDKRF